MHDQFRATAAAVALVAAVAFAAPAQAAFTPIGSNPSEPTLFQILDSIYGPGNYARVNDSLDNRWPMLVSPRSDIVVDFQVRYAADRGEFGFYRDGSGAFRPLFSFDAGMPATNVTQTGPYSANPDGSFTIPLSDLVTDTVHGTFEWAYWNRTANIQYSSNVLDNGGVDPARRDHMVTFEIEDGNPDTATFVVGWEDRVSFDYDYQDAVIQLVFRAPADVPEPATLGLFGLGLVGLAGLRRRRA